MAVPQEPNDVKAINLGLSRAGTMSMYNALKILGYRAYHMSEACRMASKGHLVMWNEAIEAKYGAGVHSGRPTSVASYNKSDFSKILNDYDALTDIPSVLFIPELLAAYPNAALILTTHPRGVDGWLRSMKNSYFRVCNWRVWSWPLMPYDVAFSRPYMTLIRRVVEIWTGTTWPAASNFDAVEPHLRKFYVHHNNEMRRIAHSQGRELLEFDPTMGWQPLCWFLGKEVPHEPYPRINEGDYAANLHKVAVFKRLQTVFGPAIVKTFGGIAVIGLAWWWMRTL